MGDKIEAFGLLMLRQILYYEGFEERVNDFLVTLLVESHKKEAKPHYSRDMVHILASGLKVLVARVLPHFQLKLRAGTPQQQHFIVVPEQMDPAQAMRKIGVLLQVIVRVQKVDIQCNPEGLHGRAHLTYEMVRLAYELSSQPDS